MKDLLLSQEKVNNFDRAMDIKEVMDEEKKRINNGGKQGSKALQRDSNQK